MNTNKNAKGGVKGGVKDDLDICPLTLINTFKDFMNDLSTTFPEYKLIIDKWRDGEDYNMLFKHCQKVYPPHFFNIIYKNDDIFKADESVPAPNSKSKNRNSNDNKNCDVILTDEFFPGIHFSAIWGCKDISEQTRNIIWNYLQLILCSVVGTIHNSSAFGEETANLFGAISPDDMQSKLADVMNDMKGFLSELGKNSRDCEKDAEPNQSGQSANDLWEWINQQGECEGEYDCNNEPKPNGNGNGNGKSGHNNDNETPLPNIENLQEHLNTILGGKIGQFAKEIAQEWAFELDIDLDEEQTESTGNDNGEKVGAMFKKLMQDPTKFMTLIKRVGERFQEKLRSGELTQKEMMQEAKELFAKMKDLNIPGMENIQSLLSGLMKGKGRGGANNAASAAAAETMNGMRKQMQFEEMREKLRQSRERLDKKKKMETNVSVAEQPMYSEEELIAMFETVGRGSGSCSGSLKKPSQFVQQKSVINQKESMKPQNPKKKNKK